MYKLILVVPLLLIPTLVDSAYARSGCDGYYHAAPAAATAPATAKVPAPAAAAQVQRPRAARRFSYQPAEPIYTNSSYYGGVWDHNYHSAGSRFSYGQRPASSKANFNYGHYAQ